jgi:glutamate/tyrosine decarboxylase-like PLP-dependent enzyme
VANLKSSGDAHGALGDSADRDTMSERPAIDTLGLDEEQMRALGYRVVDIVVDHLKGLGNERAISVASRATLERAIGRDLPRRGMDPVRALERLRSTVLGCMQHGDHPRYFARVPSPSSFAGIAGDWLAVGLNAIASTWAGASGPATLELIVLDWLRGLLGMPEGSEGILTSGGSMANFMGLAVCFSNLGRGAVYLNDQTHASLRRNLLALGVPDRDIRTLPTGPGFRVDVEAVADAMAADRAVGRRPILVIANAGTINTGASDPLRELALLCHSEGLWLHVDGAYGAPAALTAKGRTHLDGLELADSLVFDPHKWLFQPYDCGCLLVRHPGALEKAFAMHPEYLRDLKAHDSEVDLYNRSLELTRRARAVKIWMTLVSHGIEKVAAAIARGIELAEHAETLIRADHRTWELVTPAQIGVVTFAKRGCGPGAHQRMVRQLSESGFATLSTTELASRSVLRLCTINPLTTKSDIEQTLDRLARCGDSPAQAADPRDVARAAS